MIEDEIKKEFDNYEIKTTSKMILDKMPKKKKNPFLRLDRIIPIISASISVAILVIVLSFNISKNGGNGVVNGETSVSLVSNSLKSQLALEVLYAGSMDEANTNNLVSLLNNEISASDYKKAIDNIDEIYPLFENVYSSYDSITISYESGEYDKLGAIYKYKYVIDEYIMYSNIYFITDNEGELEIEGRIVLELNNVLYSGKLELEKEAEDGETESELKITYTSGSDKITIKREVETESHEAEKSYSYKVEGSKNIEKKIKIKKEDNKNIFEYDYKNSTNNVTIELDIEKSNNGYLIDYRYESDTEEIEAEDIILTIKENERTYTLDDLVEKRK